MILSEFPHISTKSMRTSAHNEHLIKQSAHELNSNNELYVHFQPAIYYSYAQTKELQSNHTILPPQWQVKSKFKDFRESQRDTLITNTRTHLHVLEGIKQLHGLGMNAALTCANLMRRIMQKLPKCVQPLTHGCLLQLPGHRVISS